MYCRTVYVCAIMKHLVKDIAWVVGVRACIASTSFGAFSLTPSGLTENHDFTLLFFGSATTWDCRYAHPVSVGTFRGGAEEPLKMVEFANFQNVLTLWRCDSFSIGYSRSNQPFWQLQGVPQKTHHQVGSKHFRIATASINRFSQLLSRWKAETSAVSVDLAGQLSWRWLQR